MGSAPSPGSTRWTGTRPSSTGSPRPEPAPVPPVSSRCGRPTPAPSSEIGSTRCSIGPSAWLGAHVPEDGAVGLCWGDARPGNIIWRDFACVCVTDFEAACIAGPEHDLGWWLMFDRWVHETYGVPRLPGEPTRDEQRRIYEEMSGRPVGDTTFEEVFAAARYAAIVVRVMNRSVARGDMPPEQTIWLDNPASTCLAQLLDERT